MKKLTLQDILSLIADVKYETHGTLTVCIMTLNCGFKLVGTSACLNPKDFNVEIGENLAHKDAVDKLCQLEGYAQLRLNEQE